MGDTNRAVAETTMNATSSRSHCVFTASLESRPVGAATLRRSKLHLVDLAGSERVSKTGASGNTLNEALCINTSLHFLEMVIVALQERERKGRLHIPYRNSMLTSVLRDSLGGNCKTVMVATMHPGLAHTDESISTCRFAQRVAKVTNVAEINEEVDQAALIEKLKQENRKLREEGGMADDAAEVQLGPEELASLHAALRAFVRDPDAHATVTWPASAPGKRRRGAHVRHALWILKSMLRDAQGGRRGRGARRRAAAGGSGGDGGGRPCCGASF